jgi:hypothetical protein
MLRPMRPNPLMPTLMGIFPPLKICRSRELSAKICHRAELKMLGVVLRNVNASALGTREIHIHKTLG